LPKSQFIRIHRSCIVQISQIEQYVRGSGGAVILTNKVTLPVSKAKKEALLNLLAII